MLVSNHCKSVTIREPTRSSWLYSNLYTCLNCISQKTYPLVLRSTGSGPNGTIGPPAQPRVLEELSSESDAAMIRCHKMAALCASGLAQKTGSAATGVVQVLRYGGVLHGLKHRQTIYPINGLLQ